MDKYIPEDMLRSYLNEGLRYSMGDLHELAELVYINYDGIITYTNSTSLFCLDNFSHEICQLLLTPFKELPLLAGNIGSHADTDYKKVYEWMLRKG